MSRRAWIWSAMANGGGMDGLKGATGLWSAVVDVDVLEVVFDEAEASCLQRDGNLYG